MPTTFSVDQAGGFGKKNTLEQKIIVSNNLGMAVNGNDNNTARPWGLPGTRSKRTIDYTIYQLLPSGYLT